MYVCCVCDVCCVCEMCVFRIIAQILPFPAHMSQFVSNFLHTFASLMCVHRSCVSVYSLNMRLLICIIASVYATDPLIDPFFGLVIGKNGIRAALPDFGVEDVSVGGDLVLNMDEFVGEDSISTNRFVSKRRRTRPIDSESVPDDVTREIVNCVHSGMTLREAYESLSEEKRRIAIFTFPVLIEMDIDASYAELLSSMADPDFFGPSQSVSHVEMTEEAFVGDLFDDTVDLEVGQPTPSGSLQVNTKRLWDDMDGVDKISPKGIADLAVSPTYPIGPKMKSFRKVITARNSAGGHATSRPAADGKSTGRTFTGRTATDK